MKKEESKLIPSCPVTTNMLSLVLLDSTAAFLASRYLDCTKTHPLGLRVQPQGRLWMVATAQVLGGQSGRKLTSSTGLSSLLTLSYHCKDSKPFPQRASLNPIQVVHQAVVESNPEGSWLIACVWAGMYLMRSLSDMIGEDKGDKQM